MTKTVYNGPNMEGAKLHTTDTPAMTTGMGRDQPVQVVSQAKIEEIQAIEDAETQPTITESSDLDEATVLRDLKLEKAALRELALEEVATETNQQVTSATHVNEMSSNDVDDILSASVIACPLQMPNFLDVRSRDPNYRLRWVNFKAQSGARYDAACAMGFRKAVAKEVVGLNSSIMIAGDGIKYYDVILMAIETKKLLGHYKWNFMRSVARVKHVGQEALQRAKQDVQSGLRQEGVSQEAFQNPGERPKLDFYIPGDKEILSR
jgi:hypothetical protein